MLQLLIPLFHTPSAQAADAWVGVRAEIPVCHVEPASADSGQPPGKQTPHTHPVCPVCLGLHLSSTYTPPAGAGFLPLLAKAEVIRFEDKANVWRATSVNASARARAPPVAA